MGTDGKSTLFTLAPLVLAFAVVFHPAEAVAQLCPAMGEPTAAPARGGSLLIEIAPQRLLLGAPEPVLIQGQVPVGATNVEVSAFLGQISEVLVNAAGRVTAQYTPPQGFAPAVDIVAIWEGNAQARRFGFAALPLVGQGTATVKTRSRANAGIRIGVDRFGPVRANPAGIAEILVNVPPGISCGYDDRDRPVDLGTPAALAGALFLVPQDAPLLSGGSASVFTVLLSEDGSMPLNDDSPLLVVSPGQSTARNPRGQGVVEWTISAPRSGSGTMSLQLTHGEPPPLELTVNYQEPPPSPVVTVTPLEPPLARKPPPKKFIADNLTLGATAGLAGTFGNTLGCWLGLSVTGRARLFEQSIHAVLAGTLFAHSSSMPLQGLEDEAPPRGQVRTILVPVQLGLGWSHALRGPLLFNATGLAGVGLGRTDLEVRETATTATITKVDRSTGASLAARVGLGWRLSRTVWRLDAGYNWTSPSDALAQSPGLSLWFLALAFDVDLLSPPNKSLTP